MLIRLSSGGPECMKIRGRPAFRFLAVLENLLERQTKWCRKPPGSEADVRAVQTTKLFQTRALTEPVPQNCSRNRTSPHRTDSRQQLVAIATPVGDGCRTGSSPVLYTILRGLEVKVRGPAGRLCAGPVVLSRKTAAVWPLTPALTDSGNVRIYLCR